MCKRNSSDTNKACKRMFPDLKKQKKQKKQKKLN